MKKFRTMLLGVAAAALLTVSMGTPAVAAQQAAPVTVVAQAAESSVAMVPTPCEGPTNVRFSQYGPGFTTSKITNCTVNTIRVQFAGVVGIDPPDAQYSSCRTLSPGASTTIRDGLISFWTTWRWC